MPLDQYCDKYITAVGSRQFGSHAQETEQGGGWADPQGAGTSWLSKQRRPVFDRTLYNETPGKI
jgi:hypothetical protein